LLFALVKHTYTQTLSEDTIDIEEVVVTGNRIEVAKSNVPLSVSSISKKEINRMNETNILPMISKKTPGVFVTERGVTGFGLSQGSAGHINIRGTGGSPNTQALMLVDGHPQFMGIFGHPLPDAYVTSDIEKVEVIRGPASILYGSNAMGGVINLITEKQQNDGFRSNSKLMYGSHNTQKYSTKAGYKKDNFSIMGSLNYDETDGHRDSSDFNIVNGYLKTSYNLNEHFKLKADASLAKYKSQDPGRIMRTAGKLIDIRRGRASFTLENDYEDAQGEMKLYYNFGEHEISDGFHSTDHLSGVMLYESFNLFPQNLITVGTEYKNYGGFAENTNAGIEFGDKTINELAAYALIQQRFLDKFVINSGLRMEKHELYGVEWVPQAGFAYHPFVNTTLKGSVAKGFRSPTMMELYLFGRANKDLNPERMMNYEISFLQNFSKLNMEMEITGFVARGDNIIQSVNFGEFKNSGEFKKSGIESALKYAFNKNLDIQTHYTYLNLDEPILAAPKHQFYFGANYSPGPFNIHLDVEHINGIYTITRDLESFGLSSPKTETYTTLNGKVSYQLKQNSQFFISAENLTGTDYSITYGYPMPKATFFGGVNFNF
ncbi:MAG: TonB-dependent receptor plug domain-containing protein, partial [Bacteroidota bacterium]